MNKVVAVIGVIVLLMLATLFFCVGFFTGSTVIPGTITEAISSETKKENGDNLTKENIDRKLGSGDVTSAAISDKIMGILATAGCKVENLSEIARSKKTSTTSASQKTKLINASHFTVDSLLKEIAASHNPQDDCSYEKTMSKIREQNSSAEQILQGKKVVFIGYFRNEIAAQIQKLLTGRGYKTHVGLSGDKCDSFVFCGPFKKDETANKLFRWLQTHNFSEARIVSVSREAIEETLYDAMDDVNELATNEEKTIPEINSANNTNANVSIAPGARPAIMQTAVNNQIPAAFSLLATPQQQRQQTAANTIINPARTIQTPIMTPNQPSATPITQPIGQMQSIQRYNQLQPFATPIAKPPLAGQRR